MISISDILKELESGKVCDLKVVSYDRKRKKGGKVKHYPEAKLVQANKSATQTGQRMKTEQEQMQAELEEIRRNPQHKKWYTRNIVVMQGDIETSIIEKIHPLLIIEFNGEPSTI